MNKNYDIDFYEKLIKYNSNTHDFWIKYFNNIVLKNIKEDWIFMIGCDSFLYLNGQTIDEYINDILKINENIFQIAFPWLAGYNLDNLELKDYCKDINKLYFQNHNHTYGMAKVSEIEKIHSSSHYFIPKSTQQIIYLPDNIVYEKNNNILPYDIFNINKFNIDNMNNNNIYALHVQLRNFDEILIKDYFSWSLKTQDKKNNLKKLILEKNYGEFIKNTYGLRLNYILNNNCKKN